VFGAYAGLTGVGVDDAGFGGVVVGFAVVAGLEVVGAGCAPAGCVDVAGV